MMLDVTGPVANRYAMLLVCNAGEKYFAPTLIRGVGADWLGCIQGAWCLWVAIRAKNISPLHWLVVVGLTNRVANMVCGVAGCVSGEKYFAPTLVGGVGADGSGCEQGRCGCWLRFGRKIFRPYIDWWCCG